MTLFEMACELLEAARAEHVDAAMEVLTWHEAAATSDVRRLGVQMALARRIDEHGGPSAASGGAGTKKQGDPPIEGHVERLHHRVIFGQVVAGDRCCCVDSDGDAKSVHGGVVESRYERCEHVRRQK